MQRARKNKDVSVRQRRRQEKSKIPLSYVVPAIIVIIIVIGLIYYNATNTSTTTIANTSKFPFPCLTSSGEVIHVHPWVRIVINGQNVTIPADIGIAVNSAGVECSEPMHTHDASGIIHIESPDSTTQYTLDKFFQIWNVTYGSVTINGESHPIVFNSTDILGFKADSTHSIVFLVDGKNSTAFGTLDLNQYDYCNAQNSAGQSSPCYATAQGDPYYNGSPYPFGTGHTIVIEYETV